MTRWLTRIAVGGVVLLAASLGIAWMCMQHIPTWYQPLWLSQREVDAAQHRLEQVFEAVSQNMAEGHEFTITFSSRQLNEMLSVQQATWPAGTPWMSPHLRTPLVIINSEDITLAARGQVGNVQSILSVQLRPQVEDNRLTLAIQSCRSGALPLPTALLARNLGGTTGLAEHAPGRDLNNRVPPAPWANLSEQLLAGQHPLSIDARFTWPNGDIPFRVSEIALDHNLVTLHIRPELR